VAESFFSSLKKERIRGKVYPSRNDARSDVFDYIEVFYNRQPQRLTLLWLMRNDIPALWPDQRRMLDQFK